jgi:hypothetical protein
MSEEKKKKDILVVKELPAQPVNKYIGDDGIEYDLIPVEEALKEILVIVRKLDSKL